MRIVQPVVAVVPPLLILWWGGTYLVDAGRLLLAPGVPVSFDYKSPEGVIRVRAEGYSLDPNTWSASAHGLTAVRANGLSIASAQLVTASGLNPLRLRPNVTLRGVRAHLVRDARGFDILRLLPPRKGKPSQIPYSVTVLDARVAYVDLTFHKPIAQDAISARIAADGMGDDWTVTGPVSLPGVGVASFRAQSLPNLGITIDARTPSLRLERLATAVMPGLQARRLIAYGPVRVDLPKVGRARVAATLQAVAEGVRYGRYAVESAQLNGRVSDAGFEGRAIVRQGAIRASFDGTATLKSGGGQVVASVPSPAALPGWVRPYLPPKVAFRDARYEGWVGWKGLTVHADGDAAAARAQYGPDALDAVRARVALSTDRIDVRGLTAAWQGAPLAADASYAIRARTVSAAVLAPRLALERVATRLGNHSGVSGGLAATALVSGTATHPTIEASVSGRVALKGRALGDIQARGAWLDGAARIDRLRADGPLGAIVAGGKVAPDGSLDLRAEARGIRIERLAPDVKGLVSAELTVGGTLRKPLATGRLEAYRLSAFGQTLPAAGADLSADRRHIGVTLFTAVRGTGRVEGRVETILEGPGVRLSDPRTWLVNGRAALTGLQVGEIPGAERVGDVAGLLSIPRVDVTGRLGDPVANADLASSGLIVRGVRIDAIHGHATVDRRSVRLTDLGAVAAEGKVTGSGAYAFASRDGSLDLSVEDVRLERLLADVSQDVVVEGSLSAPKIHLALRKGRPFGTAEGSLSAVKVNNVLAGDGNWSLDANGDRINADASVGRLDPTLRALDATASYNVKAKSLAATIQAKDVPAQAVVAAVESGRVSSEDEADRLSTIKGDLSGTVSAIRTADGDLKVDATDLRVAGIHYRDIDYGTFTAVSVLRRGGLWTATDVALLGPAGNVHAGGTVEESGEVSLKASGEGVRLAAFSPFVPDLAQFPATAHFAVDVKGRADAPEVVGTAGVDGLLASTPGALATSTSPDATTMSVDLTTLDVKDGASRVAGVLRYGERFGGLFSFASNWHYAAPVDDASIDAKLDLGELKPIDPLDPSKGLRTDSVALSEIPGLSPYIDKSRGNGTLTGGFTANGTFASPRVGGGLHLVAERLGIIVPGDRDRPITRVDDTLQNVRADLGFDGRNAPKVDASLGFSRGGTLTAGAGLGDLGKRSFLDILRETRDWKGLPIKAFAEIKDDAKVTIRQTVAGATTGGTLVGRVDAVGPAARPNVTGAFFIAGFETSLPSLGEGDASTAVPIIDPVFDLTASLAKQSGSTYVPDPGRFRTATADLYLTGDVSIKGPLSNPRANAEFVTDRGSIRLPGGVVRIDKGGQISFDYRRPLSGGTPASASVDLQGRSQLTLARTGFGSQRYDVTLDIRGDLLRDNGLQFDATSDPPDLSKDEILNALGGTELISGVAAGGSGTERNIRNAFAGFALPGLLDPITSGLAHGLGLDYVSLEYNEFDQATINFARSLGPDFSFQGRQQVGTPTPGYRSIYDLRLSYNPRRLLPKLSRMSFTVGTDQDRPWKFSVEYGTRFGQRSAPAKQKHLLFPAKDPRTTP